MKRARIKDPYVIDPWILLPFDRGSRLSVKHGTRYKMLSADYLPMYTGSLFSGRAYIGELNSGYDNFEETDDFKNVI